MSARSAIQAANIARASFSRGGLAACWPVRAWAQSRLARPRPRGSDILARARTAHPLADLPCSARTKPMRVDVDLVLVPVTVTDAYNRPVVDLPQQDFTLYEGGVAQPIRYFSNEDAPISVGLILDCSGSMRNKIEYEREALAEFFKYANPQDDYFAISVSSHPEVIATSQQSIETIQAKLGEADAQGGTALYDAVYLGISRHEVGAASTEGAGHHHGRGRQSQPLQLARNPEDGGRGRRADLRNRHLRRCAGALVQDVRRTLGPQVAEPNHGSYRRASYRGRRPQGQIPKIAALISRELRNQYVLGYRPSNVAHDGKWRKVQVMLTKSATPLYLHFKQGYVAPEE